jgi:hypothetical protein
MGSFTNRQGTGIEPEPQPGGKKPIQGGCDNGYKPDAHRSAKPGLPSSTGVGHEAKLGEADHCPKDRSTELGDVEERGAIQPREVSKERNITRHGHQRITKGMEVARVGNTQGRARFKGEHPTNRWSNRETLVPDYAPLENQIKQWDKDPLIEAWFPSIGEKTVCLASAQGYNAQNFYKTCDPYTGDWFEENFERGGGADLGIIMDARCQLRQVKGRVLS